MEVILQVSRFLVSAERWYGWSLSNVLMVQVYSSVMMHLTASLIKTGLDCGMKKADQMHWTPQHTHTCVLWKEMLEEMCYRANKCQPLIEM